ncbi:FAD-dependent monooxygenase [Mesorhizobium sp. M0701]|uniref:FAD-dependent oxidoreductase n=1 Tax=Mesorhizobium sp. M0701 TaxID=2956989 RepID=UPI0033376869
MTASRDASILIVGAGPTGLTAAVELARRGIAPRIIDRKEGPTPLAKAVGISSHSLDILEPSKVAARLLAEGLKIRRARFYFEGRALGEIDFSILPHRHNFLLSLPQRDTESLMTDTLKGFGIDVEWRSTFAGMAEHKGRAEVRIEAPDGRDEASFDLVFGADGAQSTVRDAMGIGFDGYTHRRQWSIADADIDDWPYEPTAAHAFLHRNGDVGFIIPIGEKRYRAVSNSEDALARIPGNYRITRLLRADRFHIPVRQAPRYQTACVFLGGDAAHVHSPLGARGMNLGIEDAGHSPGVSSTARLPATQANATRWGNGGSRSASASSRWPNRTTASCKASGTRPSASSAICRCCNGRCWSVSPGSRNDVVA